MSITLSYPVLSDPVSKTELETNFSDLATKFGNIIGSDLSATASIIPTALSVAYQEVWVTLKTTAAWPIAGTIVDTAPIPGLATDARWYFVDGSWVCSDTGDGEATFDLVLGSYSALGVWSASLSLATDIKINDSGVLDKGNQERFGSASDVTFATAPVTIALVSKLQGVGVTSAGFFSLTCRFKRYLTT